MWVYFVKSSQGGVRILHARRGKKSAIGMVWYMLVAQWKDKLEREYRENDWNV
jgi:hypothetical protein